MVYVKLLMTGSEVICLIDACLSKLKIQNPRSYLSSVEFHYVNDIGHSGKANILSFADGTTLYLSGSDLKQLYDDANIQINNLYECFFFLQIDYH